MAGRWRSRVAVVHCDCSAWSMTYMEWQDPQLKLEQLDTVSLHNGKDRCLYSQLDSASLRVISCYCRLWITSEENVRGKRLVVQYWL